MNKAIANLPKLFDTVMAGATHRDSILHGESHWKCVAWTGLELCRKLPEADRAVVFLFGLLHDSKRLNDGHDPQHGRRAGRFAQSLQSSVYTTVSPIQLHALVAACHDGAMPTRTYIVGRADDRHMLGRRSIKPLARENAAGCAISFNNRGEGSPEDHCCGGIPGTANDLGSDLSGVCGMTTRRTHCDSACFSAKKAHLSLFVFA